MRILIALLLAFLPLAAVGQNSTLPFDVVFKGRATFDRLVAQAPVWKTLPLGERIAAVGMALCGTPYKGYTLEIDDRIEAPSANLTGLDCWTFFEVSLAFARLIEHAPEYWSPKNLLRYLELDRYRGGRCDGTYLSRLHYLEEWLLDNSQRGLVKDLTRELGGERVTHSTGEMTRGWKGYRYMVADPAIRAAVADMEDRIGAMPLYHIPLRRVAEIEPRLQTGDIIGICSSDGRGIATSHVGIAVRSQSTGVLHFMHASAPRNFGKVLIDEQLSSYLKRYSTHRGIIVARPLR